MQLMGGLLEQRQQQMLGQIFKGSNQAIIIDMFRMNAYDAFNRPSAFSIQEIVEKTKLTRNTVRAAVTDLVEQCILNEDTSHRMHVYSLNRDRLSRLAYLFEP